MGLYPANRHSLQLFQIVLGFTPRRMHSRAHQSQNDAKIRRFGIRPLQKALQGIPIPKRFGTTPLRRQDDGFAVLFCKNGDAGLAPFTTEIDCCRIIRCFECSLIVLEFLNSHIRSKNALPHTFPTPSYTSGKRKADFQVSWCAERSILRTEWGKFAVGAHKGRFCARDFA